MNSTPTQIYDCLPKRKMNESPGVRADLLELPQVNWESVLKRALMLLIGRRHATAKRAPILRRVIRGDQRRARFISPHEDLEQIFSRARAEFLHAEIRREVKRAADERASAGATRADSEGHDRRQRARHSATRAARRRSVSPAPCKDRGGGGPARQSSWQRPRRLRPGCRTHPGLAASLPPPRAALRTPRGRPRSLPQARLRPHHLALPIKREF